MNALTLTFSRFRKGAALAAAGLMVHSVQGAEFQWNTQSNDQSWNDVSNWLSDGEPATGLPGAGDNIGAPIDFGVPPYGTKVRLTGNQEVNNVDLPLIAAGVSLRGTARVRW